MKAIIVHGGAGKHISGRFREKLEVLKEAASSGYRVLKAGGVFLKLFGRVGDTPIPGAGIYATHYAGATATGIGEGIVRTCLSRTTCSFIHFGISPGKAAEAAIDLIENTVKTSAGIIALDTRGNVGFAYNTRAMPVAFIKERMYTPATGGIPADEMQSLR